MPILIAPPAAVVVASQRDWLHAPAVAAGGIAFLASPAAFFGPGLVTSTTGLSLRVRRDGTIRVVVGASCDATGDDLAVDRCGRAMAPTPAGDGFAFGLVIDSRSGFLVAAQSDGNRVLAGDGDSQPPVDYAASDTRVVWIGGVRILGRALDGASGAAVLLRPRDLGGRPREVATAGERLAWLADAGDGSTVVGVLDAPGSEPRRYAEPPRRGVTIERLAVAEDGTVAFVRSGRFKRRDRFDVMTIDPAGQRVQRVRTRLISRLLSYAAPRPALGAGFLSVRLPIGADAGSETIRTIELTTGRQFRSDVIARRLGRLSDPAIGLGHLVWSRSLVAGEALRRSQILSARLPSPGTPVVP